ncbi:MAG: hypothetical protein ACRD30_01890 [Bryobacteraceae bacterium]
MHWLKSASLGLLLAACAHAQMNDAGMYLMNLASGTSINSQPMPMIMSSLGDWQTMLMGTAFVADTQQSGPRGGDKFFSTNWLMAAAQRPIGSNSALQLDLMLSLEPATVTDRRYPELFQTGEAAFGEPIIDGQHPHNFIMALGVHYTRAINEHTIFDLYLAPVGDPALGPAAFPHRASAAELPQAPISHHWQDSTHIADDVITAGVAYRKFRLEASGFHGAEPGENRWTIDAGPVDSWSARLWYRPSSHWAAQFSAGRLTHPEALEPGDQVRATASVEYTRGGWSSSAIWGRNHNTATHHDLNSYLIESVRPIGSMNFITGRAEMVDKDELSVPGIYRIGAYTIGYTRDVNWFEQLETGIGANFTMYSMPDSLKPVYGNRPAAANLFIRLRLRGHP